jgi:probable phosphoglycerate mutase
MSKGKLIGFILRHGETELNASNCFRGWSPVPLDDNGIQQAHAAAKFLQKAPLVRIVSSPLPRARTTAEIVASKHSLYVVQEGGLLPWHVGMFGGLDRDQNNPALRLFVQNPYIVIPGGESLEDFEQRQFAFWKEHLGLAKATGLTLFVAHTSNCVALVNFTEGNENVEPEVGDSVEPGGVEAIYWDGTRYKVEPIFGGDEQAVFGGS